MDRKDVLLQNLFLYFRKAFVTVVVLIFIAARGEVSCTTDIINTKDNFVVKKANHNTLSTGDEIVLGPGYHAEAWTEFYAQVEPVVNFPGFQISIFKILSGGFS